MAVTKFNFLNQSGLQDAATLLYKSLNTRIRERIATVVTDGTSGTINSRTDDNHTLSAKVILGLTDAINTAIGDSDDVAADNTLYGYVNGQVSDINNAIGDDQDTATDGTVYGYINGQVSDINNAIGDDEDVSSDGTLYGYINGEIARVEGIISGLTHLTYQVVTGPITGVVDPQTDVIYLQHDEPSVLIANDGYVMHDANTKASYTAGGDTYYAYWDAAAEKFYKATESGGVYTVTSTELTDSDPIFSDATTGAGLAEDTTYNLYIYREIAGTPTTYEWICVGDTALTLDNYWSKTDADVTALRSLMMEALSNQQITAAVQAAFTATDPYTGTNPYIWDT